MILIFIFFFFLMSQRKWDEFGNPIGEYSDESSDDDENAPRQNIQTPVVLPEDKEYYPHAEDVYKAYTKIKHEDEDRDDYRKPIIESAKKRIIADDIKPNEIPETTFSIEFLRSLLENKSTIRNVAFVGSLGHGKTEIIDNLVKETHPNIVERELTKKDITNQVVGDGRRFDRLGWTDRLYLEKRRQMSISTEVVTLCHDTLEQKTYALNIVDTPGHPDLFDQVSCGLAMCDGVAFVVDIMEGLTGYGKKLLLEIMNRKFPFFLVLSKIDRMILEAKYPYEFAHKKILRVIEDVNKVVKKEIPDYRLLPELGNVIFTAARFSLCFSCLSVGLMYMRNYEKAKMFSMRMWGNFRCPPESSIIIQSVDENLEHPFDKFILLPLYKVFSFIIAEEPKIWSKKLKIKLSAEEMKLNTIPLLRIALSRIYGPFSSLVSSIVDSIPQPSPNPTNNAHSIGDWSKNAVVARICKFVPDQNGERIFSIARIFKGRIEPGQSFFSLSQNFEEDQSAYSNVQIGEIALSHTRYFSPIPYATEGMIVIISETTPNITGICQLTDSLNSCFEPVPIPTPLMKIAIEPLDPNKHQLMVNSISKALLCYPGLRTHVATNGEHTLTGYGELYLDCVMNDIRNSFESIEVKVSDPFVVFCETVANKSVTICYSDIDEHTKIGITAEPLEPQVIFDMDNGNFTKDNLKEELQKDGWDILAAQNALFIGPDPKYGSNILVDETFLEENKLLNENKEFIESAFKWATNEGPLCDEKIRGILFKICGIDTDGMAQNSRLIAAKIIPAFKKAMFAAILAATPRIMEPHYHVEIMVTGDAEIQICKMIIERRRGKLSKKSYILGGTPYEILNASIPLIELFGFETDIRARTNGVAFPMSWFEGWRIVDSNPLDNSMSIRPLEPAPIEFLGREFVLKTRRRKGLSDDIDLSKYCSPDLLVEIATLTGQ